MPMLEFSLIYIQSFAQTMEQTLRLEENPKMKLSYDYEYNKSCDNIQISPDRKIYSML